MRIAGVVEMVVYFADDAIVSIAHNLGFVRESACDACDDLAIPVANEGFVE